MIAGITLSRIINLIGYLCILFVSMQVGGVYDLLPPKAAAVMMAIGGTLSALSERLQGGLSKE